MAAVVLYESFLIGANPSSLVVEVSVREYDLTTLITPLWSFPRVILQIGHQVASVMVEYQLGSQLLRHELLRWWNSGS